MIKKEYKLKNKQTINIIPIGDFHIGSNEFQDEFFEQMIKKVKKLPRKRIYLMGDCLEVASKKVGDSAYEQNCTVEEQREYFINNIKPLKKDIVCYCTGNHENRLNKEFGFNIVKDMCRELGITYCNQNLDTFKVNDFDFSIFTRHGKGFSSKKHLAMGKLERNTEHIIADMYLEGHNHRLCFWDQFTWYPEGYQRIYYGYTGHFLDYKGYADTQYLRMEPPGWQLITLNKNRLVKSHQYYEEEVL